MSADGIDRRTLLGAAALAGVAGAAHAQSGAGAILSERVPIWPGAAPGGSRVRVRETLDGTMLGHITRPTLSAYRPGQANGAALLIIPGGGYRGVSIDNEGHRVATRFAAAGFHAFVLTYRMPGDGWAAGPDAPFQDAQRAMRLIGARARRDGFDAARIGVIGFSAGGHLAAWLSSQSARASYAAVDDADRLPARPCATGLLYPVIKIAGDLAHRGSREELLGADVTPARARGYDADAMVTANTPPTFLATALDDTVVPADNSLAMLAALRAARVPTEIHMFEHGGHGFGLGGPEGTLSPWPDLFTTWARPHLLK